MFSFKRQSPLNTEPPIPSSQLSWESNIVDHQRHSTRLAWRVAGTSLVIAMLSLTAVVLILPLEKTQVRVVTVDKLTGETATAVSVSQYALNPNELNDKYWSKRFLLARERYSYKILQSDYDTVRLLAAQTPWRSYAQLFEGPDSIEKKYGADIEITPVVLSSTISQYGIATIRYEIKERDLRNPDAPAKVERRVATLRYHYAPQSKASERDLIDNPLGFTVDAYQSVLEVANLSEPVVPSTLLPKARS